MYDMLEFLHLQSEYSYINRFQLKVLGSECRDINRFPLNVPGSELNYINSFQTECSLNQCSDGFGNNMIYKARSLEM